MEVNWANQILPAQISWLHVRHLCVKLNPPCVQVKMQQLPLPSARNDIFKLMHHLHQKNTLVSTNKEYLTSAYPIARRFT